MIGHDGLPIKNAESMKLNGNHVKSSSLSLSESPSDDEAFTDAPDTEVTLKYLVKFCKGNSLKTF